MEPGPEESTARNAPEEPAARLHPLLHMLQSVTGPWTRSNLLSWVLLIGAVFFLKGCILDQYTIPSGSMEDTLHGDPRFFRGDRVLTNKWVFGPRIPFTAIRLWDWAAPKRWDIVVFYAVPGSSEHSVLVKRVVGLPGERIHIANGKICVNGEAIEPPPELRDALHYTTTLSLPELEIKRGFLALSQRNEALSILNPDKPEVQKLYEEMAAWHDRVAGLDVVGLPAAEVNRLTEGVTPRTLNLIRLIFDHQQPALQYGVRPEDEFSLVPEGNYLLLGDNSPQSADGRIWGWVPRNRLLGRVCGIWWPWNRRRDFTGFTKTWWGMLLIYGLPAAFLFNEGYQYRRKKKRQN